MSRLRQLAERRRVLLARCDAQRSELGTRLAQLTPFGMQGTLRNPLTWIAAVAGLLFLGRTRKVLTFTLWLRTLLSIAGRAARLVRVVSELREPRASGEPAPRRS
ncbi:MAG TPA: hypothetical protein VET46_03760 [Steroidobacteraceae bacterium]|nr:hypothetical protein [Steroidobacteraceae bacterium]